MTITKNERGAFWTSAVNIAADDRSSPLDMKGARNLALQVDVTGTATLVGAVYVEGSMNYVSPASLGTWVALEDSAGNPLTAATIASGAGPYSDGGVSDIHWPWVRFFFDRTSGTGTITGYVTVSE
jgi:hypothetical protein